MINSFENILNQRPIKVTRSNGVTLIPVKLANFDRTLGNFDRPIKVTPDQSYTKCQ